MKNIRRSAANDGAEMYRHTVYGFRLLIPASMLAPYHKLTIGPVMLQLNHLTRTITGNVPPSWLVDLNADSAVCCESE